MWSHGSGVVWQTWIRDGNGSACCRCTHTYGSVVCLNLCVTCEHLPLDGKLVCACLLEVLVCIGVNSTISSVAALPVELYICVCCPVFCSISTPHQKLILLLPVFSYSASFSIRCCLSQLSTHLPTYCCLTCLPTPPCHARYLRTNLRTPNKHISATETEIPSKGWQSNHETPCKSLSTHFLSVSTCICNRRNILIKIQNSTVFS